MKATRGFIGFDMEVLIPETMTCLQREVRLHMAPVSGSTPGKGAGEDAEQDNRDPRAGSGDEPSLEWKGGGRLSEWPYCTSSPGEWPKSHAGLQRWVREEP